MPAYPEHPDLAFIRSLRNDRRFADHLAGNCWEILEAVPCGELPGYCAEIAGILGRTAESMTPGDSFDRYCRAGISVSAIGLDALEECRPDRETAGRLLTLMAEGLARTDRHVAALDCLRRAESEYDARRRELEESGITDMSSEDIRRIRHGSEYCRARTAVVMSAFEDCVGDPELPGFREGMASSLSQAILFFRSYSYDRDMYLFSGMMSGSGLADIQFTSAQEIPALNGHEGWCRSNNLFLDFLDGLPGSGPRCGDSSGPLAGGTADILWDDIAGSYAHCREIMHTGSEDTESVKDCFVRLYSAMDKLAALTDVLFSLSSGRVTRFPDIEDKLHISRNRYLKAMDGICGDFYPDWNRPPGRCPADRPVAARADRSLTVRNAVVFGAYTISDAPVPGCVAVTGEELRSEAMVLLRDVREAVLTVLMAWRLEERARK